MLASPLSTPTAGYQHVASSATPLASLLLREAEPLQRNHISEMPASLRRVLGRVYNISDRLVVVGLTRPLPVWWSGTNGLIGRCWVAGGTYSLAKYFVDFM